MLLQRVGLGQSNYIVVVVFRGTNIYLMMTAEQTIYIGSNTGKESAHAMDAAIAYSHSHSIAHSPRQTFTN